MRLIYLRLKSKSSFRAHLHKSDGMITLKNSIDHSIVLRNPKLVRRILGVCILDHRGNTDKWFSDNDSGFSKHW